MQAIEFETDLTGKSTLALPKKVAKQLPASGKAKVIVLYGDNDAEWRSSAYEQFMKEDSAEDAVYDKFTKGR